MEGTRLQELKNDLFIVQGNKIAPWEKTVSFKLLVF